MACLTVHKINPKLCCSYGRPADPKRSISARPFAGYVQTLHGAPLRLCKRLQAVVDDEGEADDPVDIDKLASMLSREADRLRRSESGTSASTSYDDSSSKLRPDTDTASREVGILLVTSIVQQHNSNTITKQ